MTKSPEITLLLKQAQKGDADAAQLLFQQLLESLRGSAKNMMLAERAGHTLQASALINEACVRLLQQKALHTSENRRMLFASANRAMRQILIDHARKRNADKRGKGASRESLDVILDNFESQNSVSFEDLDAALVELEKESPRQREVIEHRFFAGLTIAETAQLLGVAEGTIERDWRLARAKLYAYLKNDQD